MARRLSIAPARYLSVQAHEQRAGSGGVLALRGGGLTDTGTEAFFEIRVGGSAGARVDAANLDQVGEGSIKAGALATADRDRVRTLLQAPRFLFASPAMVTAWGHHP